MPIEIMLSDRCNLRCPWCYGQDGRNGNGPDWSRTEAALEWYFNDYEKASRHIAVFGGEPTLEWGALMRLVEWRALRQQRDGKPIRLEIITNATLLDHDRMEWLCMHDVHISPSIDGCAEAQDHGRVRPDGAGTSALVYANARRLLGMRPKASVRATFSPATVHVLDKSVRFLRDDLGFRSVNAVHASGSVEWKPEHLEQVDMQLAQVTNWYIHRVLEHGPDYVDLYHVRKAIRTIRADAAGGCSSPCGVGRGRVAVDTQNRLWPCHRFATGSASPEWQMGTVESGVTNHALIDAVRRFDPKTCVENSDHCAACPLQGRCWLWCWWTFMDAGTAYFENGALRVRIDPAACHILRAYHREGVRAVQTLQEAGVDLIALTEAKEQRQRDGESKRK